MNLRTSTLRITSVLFLLVLAWLVTAPRSLNAAEFGLRGGATYCHKKYTPVSLDCTDHPDCNDETYIHYKVHYYEQTTNDMGPLSGNVYACGPSENCNRDEILEPCGVVLE